MVGAAAASGGCTLDGSDPGPPTETADSPATDTSGSDGDDRSTATPTALAAARERYGDRFESVVDATDAGIRPGDGPIDEALTAALDDDRLVVFPGGSYGLRSVELTGYDNAGLVSAPGTRATLVPTADATAIDGLFARFLGVEDLLLSGFDLDFRARGAGGLVQVRGGGFTVSDLRVRGRLPETVDAFMFEVSDESATGRVRRLVATDGGRAGGDSVGVYVDRAHAGELRLEDCRIANFPNNGLYASTPGADDGGAGPVHVRGGRYANNNIANVRVGADGSTVRDVTVVMNEPPPRHPNGRNARGIRVRRGRDHVVENCRLLLGEDAGDGFGGVVVHADAGPTTVRDTDIVADRDGMFAVNVFAPPDGTDGGPTFRNLRVTGSAADGPAVAVRNRDGTEFRDCTVAQTGLGRGGFRFESAQQSVVADTEIAVAGVPISAVGSSVATRNVTLRLPDIGADPGALDRGAAADHNTTQDND